MNERQRRQWETLGSHDPYWAVLTHPDKQGGKWDPDAFFQTGEHEIQAIHNRARRYGLSHGTGTAVDYGCGVGRLSRALGSRFERVIGVDMSASMLAEARRVNAGYDNLKFLQNNGEDLSDIDDVSVDLVYSNIVLQHSTRATQKAVIREFCRILKPGGGLVFQTPSHHRLSSLKSLIHRLAGNRVLNLLRGLRHGRDNLMDMHTLPRSEVERLIQEGGLEIMAAEENRAAGPIFVSYLYFARKPAPNEGSGPEGA